MTRVAILLVMLGVLQQPFVAVAETILTATNAQPLAYFGTSVATQFETLVAGAPGEAAVYVYQQDGDMEWMETAKLEAPADVTLFGTAVALDEDTLAVSAMGDDNAGVVFIYVKTGDSWTEQAQVSSDGLSVEDRFGDALALQGDTLVVTASGDDELGKNAGAVYVYTRNSGAWTLAYKLFGSDLENNDQFGSALALDGDTLVVGAYGDDDEGSRAGAAYVLVRDGSGTWLEQAKLTASNGGRGHVFGRGGMAAFGDTVAIGAERYEDGSGVRTGAVYVYTRGGTEWVETAQVTATEGDQGDLFGKSLALYEDSLVVGSQGDDEKVNSGAVYVYSRSGQTWTEESKIKASDADNGDKLGSSVALFDTTLVAGASARDDEAGAVYIYNLESPTAKDCGFYLYDTSVEPPRLLTKLESNQEPYNLYSYGVTAEDVSFDYVPCSDAPPSVSVLVDSLQQFGESTERCFLEAPPFLIPAYELILGDIELIAMEHPDDNCGDGGDEVQVNIALIDNPCRDDFANVKVTMNCLTCATDGSSVRFLNPNRRTTIWASATDLPDNEEFVLEACIFDRFCVRVEHDNFFGDPDFFVYDYRVFYNGVKIRDVVGLPRTGNPGYTQVGNCA